MKFIPAFLLLISFASCTDRTGEINIKLAAQQGEIDSLKTVIANMRPGLGELMSIIQTHHAKLWFAGTNENWDLAKFEVDEINEQLESAKQLQDVRPEVIDVPQIIPHLDSISMAIEAKDTAMFRAHFVALTNTCNSCHQSHGFGFNEITIPTAPPVTNQNFRPER